MANVEFVYWFGFYFACVTIQNNTFDEGKKDTKICLFSLLIGDSVFHKLKKSPQL